MDPVYQSVLDPMAALAFAAAVTSRIRLGVAVINLPFVSPVYLAKQAATVDVLSGGRHDLGLGLGWMPEEFALTGASMERRGARAAEYVAGAADAVGRQPCEFSGEFYTVPRGSQAAAAGPARRAADPARRHGPAALRRVGRIADGWVTSSRTDLSRIGDADRDRAEAAAGGRAGPGGAADHLPRRRPGRRAGAPAATASGCCCPAATTRSAPTSAGWPQQGVTEVFYDLNWDPQIGSPDAEPPAAADRARAGDPARARPGRRAATGRG